MKGLSEGAEKTPSATDIEPAVLLELPEIEHVVADRDADARREAVLGGEHAVGEILDREVGGRVDGDEGAEFGVVGVGHNIVPPVIAPSSRA